MALIEVVPATFTALTVTPAPLTCTVDWPETKSVPVIVTFTTVPTLPEFGCICVIVGAAVTVNVATPLVPLGVVTVTFRAPVGAFAAIVTVIVIDVAPVTFTPSTILSRPLTCTVDWPETKSVPVSVTFTTVPTLPEFGCICVIVGGAVTVNVAAPLVPLGVVTVTFRAPVAAFAAIVNVVVIDVGLVTLHAPTVTPSALTCTVVWPETKSVPVSVTFTTVP